MPYIIGTMFYPSHKQGDITKRYIEITGNYPPDESLYEQLGAPVRTKENGVVVMSIWEIKKGKMDEALLRLGKFYFEFIDIEEYEYTLRVWHTFQEAVAIGGLKLPE
ncbi:MAG: hypothetical protein ACTSPN_06065 [Promethearchaeota archaeon]